MYAAIVKALVNTNGIDLSGKNVEMPAGSYHLVSKHDLKYYLAHPDAFSITREADLDAPALIATDASGNTALVGAGKKFSLVKAKAAQPIIASGTYLGTGQPKLVELGFTPDLVFVKGEGKAAGHMMPTNWYGGMQAFGNNTVTGTNQVKHKPANGGLRVTRDAYANELGVTYHYLALSDNGSEMLKTFAYVGYRNQTFAANGSMSDPVTLDVLEGTSPDLVHVKRDNAAAGCEGVFITRNWVKKENTAAPDATICTLNADGTIDLSTNVAVNDNDSKIIGEAHDAFSLHNRGTHWDELTYTGNGSTQVVECGDEVVGAIIIPQAATAISFWFESMGQSASADGGATALHATAKVVGGNGKITVSGSDTNASGVEYRAVVFYSRAAPEKPKLKCGRKTGVRINAGGYINCGTDASLAISGAFSQEWIGSISDHTGNEQTLMARMTGSRGSPTAASANFGIAYLLDPANGLDVCTSDQWTSSVVTPDVFKRFRSGLMLEPFRDYHILVTYDGVDKWCIYLDGKLAKWRRMPMSVVGLPEITATAGLQMGFGARYTGAAWAGQEKTIHKFGRLYGRELTPAEVYQMYCRNFLVTLAPYDLTDIATAGVLIEEWKFNEGSGTTVAATKASANNGAMTNCSWVLG